MIQPQLAVEVNIAAGAAAHQIAVVVVVGHLMKINTAAKLGAELMPVLPIELVAVVVFAGAVVRQPFAVDDTLVFGLQIAELPAQLQAAAADKMRFHGGVVIGRQVEIIRHPQFKAIAADFHRGRHQAAFAVAIERKINPRRVH